MLRFYIYLLVFIFTYKRLLDRYLKLFKYYKILILFDRFLKLLKFFKILILQGIRH